MSNLPLVIDATIQFIVSLVARIHETAAARSTLQTPFVVRSLHHLHDVSITNRLHARTATDG